jgi:hypothetical protein
MNIIFTDDFFEQGRQKQFFSDERAYPTNRDQENYETRGWNDPWAIPWPKIPGGGEPDRIPLPDDSGNNCPCEDSKNVMGYYIPWHFMLEKHHYHKSKGSNITIEYINESYPECRRWGIHLCMGNIKNYIDNLVMPLVGPHLSGPREVRYFRDYAVYLMVMKTLAHEWGHYRVELLALQQMEGLTTIMKAEDVCHFSGNYLKYFRSTARKYDDFEEVFAEWCALRLGVYNSKMIRPDDLPAIFPVRKNEITKDWLIRKGVLGSMKNNSAPYGDIAKWINFDALESDQLLNEYVTGKTNLSRAIGKYTMTEGAKIIDLVMHNVNCYSRENISTRRNKPLVSSWKKSMLEIASVRPGLGLELNPQAPAFDPGAYGSKNRTSRALYLDKPLVLDSFNRDIYRLPLENFSLLPVKVYH